MKKRVYLLLLIMMLFITGCGKEKIDDKKDALESSTPLLIEVSKEGANNKLYLMGSIHAADDSVYPLPDYIVNAYQRSSSLAVEFDMIEFNKDFNKQTALLTAFVYTNGNTISDELTPELYDKAVEILTNANAYNTLVDYYIPIMWESLIENAVLNDAGLNTYKGIDMHFLLKAKEDKKSIIDLETPEYQYDVLSSFSMELQKYLLEQSIINYDDSVENMKDLYNLYKKGNQKDLEKNIFEEDKELNDYEKEYNNTLITNRNINMAQELERRFNAGEDIFCVVGLAHIIGDEGIAEIFKQNGYTINVVKES